MPGCCRKESGTCLVCICLIISTLLIILVPFCAEDFQEITDNQHVINQDGSGGSSLKQAQNKDEEAKPCFSSLKQAQNKDEEAQTGLSSLISGKIKDERNRGFGFPKKMRKFAL